jgi:hypothetical protein
MTKECDCLNWCGDDPWLKDGRATPCKKFLDEQERDRVLVAQTQEILDLCKARGIESTYDLVKALLKRVADLEHEFDRAFLEWCADRMVYVYGADPHVDYVLKLRRMAGTRS